MKQLRFSLRTVLILLNISSTSLDCTGFISQLIFLILKTTEALSKAIWSEMKLQTLAIEPLSSSKSYSTRLSKTPRILRKRRLSLRFRNLSTNSCSQPSTEDAQDSRSCLKKRVVRGASPTVFYLTRWSNPVRILTQWLLTTRFHS